MGGTFNPIHHGHLFLGLEVHHRLGLEEVWFLPNQAPVHKTTSLASASDRLAMIELAIAGRPEFQVCTLELEQERPLYTYETMDRLPKQHDYFFIAGADSLRYRWKHLDRILAGLKAMVVATRPGYAFDDLNAHLDGLGLSQRDQIRLLEMPSLDISSSEIRRRAGRDLPIGYLVPRSVEEYIEAHELYRKGVEAVSG